MDVTHEFLLEAECALFDARNRFDSETPEYKQLEAMRKQLEEFIADFIKSNNER